ncbi:MAG: MBL fold metallo-hydrolase [Myxococcales bacterium]|nr:MBL fold metallo-hydrolase [Myxococcales bacterium]
MKRWQLALGVVALIAIGVFAFRGAIVERILVAAVTRIMTADPLADFPDGLHVVLCGAGSPLPDPIRSGPCVAVVAGRKLFLVDAGSAASRNLQAVGLPTALLDAVFLTHFHSDHIDGLGELALQHWVGSNAREPLALFGPTGVGEIAAGLRQVYRADTNYRIAHHGEDIAPRSGAGLSPRPFVPPDAGEPLVVWDTDGVRITAFRVDHEPVDPAVGYRFDYAGRSAVITGDTKKSAEIARIAKGADLLVHEALSARLVGIMEAAATTAGQQRRAKIMKDIQDYHATPVDAAETAAAAGVGHLLFYHVVPPLIAPGMESSFLRGVSDAYSGQITLGRDGTRVSLPAT